MEVGRLWRRGGCESVCLHDCPSHSLSIRVTEQGEGGNVMVGVVDASGGAHVMSVEDDKAENRRRRRRDKEKSGRKV